MEVDGGGEGLDGRVERAVEELGELLDGGGVDVDHVDAIGEVEVVETQAGAEQLGDVVCSCLPMRSSRPREGGV